MEIVATAKVTDMVRKRDRCEWGDIQPYDASEPLTLGTPMKMSLFSTNEAVKQYANVSDLFTQIMGALNEDLGLCITRSLVIDDEIFELKTEKDIYFKILCLVTGEDCKEVESFIPDKLLHLTDKPNSWLKLLLALPYKDLDFDIIESVFSVISLSNLHKVTGKFIIDELVSEDSLKLFMCKTPAWITDKEDAYKSWYIENYSFIRGLLLNYFDPRQKLRFYRTKGFTFHSFVQVLFSIRDLVDMSYWDDSCDLWINLNRIGYNPIRHLHDCFKSLNAVNSNLLSHFSNDDLMAIIVLGFNEAGKNICSQPLFNKAILLHSDPLNMERYIKNIGIADHYKFLQEDVMSYGDDAKFIMERLYEYLQDDDCSRIVIHNEYTLPIKDGRNIQEVMLYIVGTLPARARRGKGLNIHELTYSDNAFYMSVPGTLDLICYLYKHRNFINDQHPIRGTRGRLAMVHGHNAVLSYISDFTKGKIGLALSDNPMDTFYDYFQKAAVELLQNASTDPFDNFPPILHHLMDDRFFHIPTAYDMIMEGELMNHCCGRNWYIENCRDHEKVFFHFQPTDMVHYKQGITFDLDCNLNDASDDQPFTISSWNGHSNASVSADHQAEIMGFIHRLNKVYVKYMKQLELEKTSQLAVCA